MRFLSLVFFVFLLFFSTVQATPQTTPAPTNDYYVAIKGGISLGSYETGLNWAFLNFIHNDEKNRLVSFSGASAGSINSLLSAAEHCQLKNLNKPSGNDFYETWNVDLSGLLAEGQAKEGLFKRDALNPSVKIIETMINDEKNTKKCSMIITMSLTRMKPKEITIDKSGHKITLQRFVVPLEVSAEAGKKITFTNIYEHEKNGAIKDKLPGVYINLPEDSDGTVSFERVKQVAFASSAFPVAFSPVVIAHCLSNNVSKVDRCGKAGTVEEGVLFSDGGLFDNSPVGVALDIMEGHNAFKAKGDVEKNIIFYINPDNYRDKEDDSGQAVKECKSKSDEDNNVPKEKAGLLEYGTYFFDSFNNATSFELQKTLISLKEKNVDLLTSNRFHHLLADFHGHFGAFYSEDFRRHDYIVGVYDGIANIAAFLCQSAASMHQCRKQKIGEYIDKYFSDENSEQEDKEFITYLYHDEFGLDNDTYAANPLVALNKAFTATAGCSSMAEDQKVPMAGYLDKLRELKNGTYQAAKFSKTTSRLMNNYDSWQAEQLNYALDNVTAMQSCGKDCNEGNEKVGDYIGYAKPIVNKILFHMDNRTWPLGLDITEKFRGSLGANLGYDVVEPGTVIGLKGRLPIFGRNPYTLDIEANRHFLAKGDGENDYTSLSIGGTRHLSGRYSLFLPTIGIGLELSDKAKYYDERSGSIYISAGLLAEMVNLKYSRRPYGVDNASGDVIRKENRFLISLDVSELIKFVGKLW